MCYRRSKIHDRQILVGSLHHCLEAAYQDLPIMDFASDVLQKVPDQLAVFELNDVLWSDWGRAERIVETLRRIGKQPAFPLEFVTADSDAGGMGRGLSGRRPISVSE